MTNHWRDIRHADLILINGANPAEAHPVGFQWFMRAKLDRGAKLIHADPRFTRTSAVADMYLRIRTGSDVAYFGGLINHVLQNNLFHDEYVRNYTNASFVVKDGYAFSEGSGTTTGDSSGNNNTGTISFDSADSGNPIIFGLVSGVTPGVLNNSGTFNVTAGGDFALRFAKAWRR